MKIKFLVLILLAGLVLGACSSSNKIIGTWEDQYGDQYEFYEDGTAVVTSYGVPITGSYEFIDDDTLKFNFDGLLGLAGSPIIDVVFSGGELRMDLYGEMLILKKID